MADQNAKSYLIRMKFGTRGFSGSLITNQRWTFRNSKWRMQYRWLTCKKLFDWDEIWCSGVFWVTDREFELQKFRMADPIWLNKLSPEIFWFDALLSRKRFIQLWNILLSKKYVQSNLFSITRFIPKSFRLALLNVFKLSF